MIVSRRDGLAHTDTLSYQCALHVEGLNLHSVLGSLQDLGLLGLTDFRADGRLETGKRAG